MKHYFVVIRETIVHRVHNVEAERPSAAAKNTYENLQIIHADRHSNFSVISVEKED